MTPGTCGLCGKQCVERQNTDGSYKGACADCRENYDAGHTPHVEQCDIDNCIVCESWRQEFGER